MHWSSANLASAKFAGLIDVIRSDISILTLLAEVLNLLDMIVNSFAHVISTKPVDRYTRPEFTGNCLVLLATPSSILRCNMRCLIELNVQIMVLWLLMLEGILYWKACTVILLYVL